MKKNPISHHFVDNNFQGFRVETDHSSADYAIYSGTILSGLKSSIQYGC